MTTSAKSSPSTFRQDAIPSLWRVLIRRLRLPIALAISLIAGATLYYTFVENFGVIDAFYMTSITLSTVGFVEVEPLDVSGRLFTIFIIGVGFVVLGYAAAILSGLFVSGEIARIARRRRRLKLHVELRDHVVVVGYGRVGVSVTDELIAQGIEVVVINTSEEPADRAATAGVTFVLGDGTNQATYSRAGLERARAVVVCAQDDPTNLVLVLTVRSLNPTIRIIARIAYPEWRDRMIQAGADIAISPYDAVAKTLATTAISGTIMDLQDMPEFGLRSQEIRVPDGSEIVGHSTRDLAKNFPSVLFLALRRDESTQLYADVQGSVLAGDVLVALGPPTQLDTVLSHVERR